MLFSVFLSYLPYTIVTAFTPGPNNIIALHAVGQGGWRAGKNVLWGIAAGFLCVMILCAVFCYELSKYIPAFSEVLKYIGAAYIAYLAVHIAISKPSYENERKMSFAKGFFLEFANINHPICHNRIYGIRASAHGSIIHIAFSLCSYHCRRHSRNVVLGGCRKYISKISEKILSPVQYRHGNHSPMVRSIPHHR